MLGPPTPGAPKWNNCVIMIQLCHYDTTVALWNNCVKMEQLCHYGTTVSVCRESCRGSCQASKVWTMFFQNDPYIVHTVTHCFISLCKDSPFFRKNIVHPKNRTSKGFTELWTIWTMFERFSIHQYYTQYYTPVLLLLLPYLGRLYFIFLIVHIVHNSRKQAPAIPSRLCSSLPYHCPYIVHT